MVILGLVILLLRISANFSKARSFSSPNCSVGEEGAGFFRGYSKSCAAEMAASCDVVDDTFIYFGGICTVSAIRSLPVVGMLQRKLR